MAKAGCCRQGSIHRRPTAIGGKEYGNARVQSDQTHGFCRTGKPALVGTSAPVAPLVPPVHVVDLMTVAGSAVFGAQWKGMEAKIVECPALSDAMPEFKTTYDIEPHAGE